MPHTPRKFSVLLAPLLLAGSLSSAAQSERWYQVELLIFSNPTGANSEQWEAMPDLAYPEPARFLVNPRQIRDRVAEHRGPSELDSFGRLWLRAASESGTGDSPAGNTGDTSDSGVTDQPAVSGAALAPTPFVTLPSAQGEFHGKTAYMERRGNYRILFHETWVQPVREEQDAIPLVIDRSGDSGDWPALQGSVNIHISRYLHVETNLWLNTQGRYLPGDWRMPAPPLGPASVIDETITEEELEEPYFISHESEAAIDATDGTGALAPEAEVDEAEAYPWRHAVLMQQKRRMRSNEVHYIDHPLMGVIVRFTPVDASQLQAMAQAEQERGALPD